MIFSISLFTLALAVLAASLAFRPASAETGMFHLRARIDGDQAATTCKDWGGTGFAEITYNAGANLLEWEIIHSGLTGPPVAAHFHGPAKPGVDAGIQVAIVNLTSPSEGSVTITEVQEEQLLRQLWYVNYHTSRCANGEVRGQVLLAGCAPLSPAPTLRPTNTPGGPTKTPAPTHTPKPTNTPIPTNTPGGAAQDAHSHANALSCLRGLHRRGCSLRVSGRVWGPAGRDGDTPAVGIADHHECR